MIVVFVVFDFMVVMIVIVIFNCLYLFFGLLISIIVMDFKLGYVVIIDNVFFDDMIVVVDFFCDGIGIEIVY